MQILSQSSKQTQKIAKQYALSLSKGKARNKTAIIITLHGNLGAGKTTFTQGFLRGLGVRKKITSPTFILFKKYKRPEQSRRASYENIYHMDTYRIKSAKEILDLNWKEIISNPKNIVLIEWPERITKIIPKNAIKIKFGYGKKETERTLQIK